MQKSQNSDDHRKQTLINIEYVRTLFQEYLPGNNETKAFLLTQRIINEYEIEIFAKIRKLCCEERTAELNKRK